MLLPEGAAWPCRKLRLGRYRHPNRAIIAESRTDFTIRLRGRVVQLCHRIIRAGEVPKEPTLWRLQRRRRRKDRQHCHRAVIPSSCSDLTS